MDSLSTELSGKPIYFTYGNVFFYLIYFGCIGSSLPYTGCLWLMRAWASCYAACEIFVPWSGIEPEACALESRFLATGSPGKSQCFSFLVSFLCSCLLGVLVYFSQQVLLDKQEQLLLYPGSPQDCPHSHVCPPLPGLWPVMCLPSLPPIWSNSLSAQLRLPWLKRIGAFAKWDQGRVIEPAVGRPWSQDCHRRQQRNWRQRSI